MLQINSGAENKEITATCAAYTINLSRECNPPMDVLTIPFTVPKVVESICHEQVSQMFYGFPDFLLTMLFLF
jgi:hypothetical protein